MGTPTYTAVDFNLELLPDREGRCYTGHYVSQEFGLHDEFALYAVRNQDGPTTLLVCSYHLDLLMRHWDDHLARHNEKTPA